VDLESDIYVVAGPQQSTTSPVTVGAATVDWVDIGLTLPGEETAPGTGRATITDREPPMTDVPHDGAANEGLFGISFSDALRAQEFLIVLTRMAAQHQLTLRDAVVVVKDDDGKVHVRETVDPQPGTSALSGAMWTGLLGLLLGGPVGWLAGIGVGAGAGALVAKVVDVGIPDEWVDWFKSAVQPNTATIVALAADIDLPALNHEASRFSGAELVHTTLRAGASADLAAALDPAHRAPGDQAAAPISGVPHEG
jgi:uncharacterized membrane protein